MAEQRNSSTLRLHNEHDLAERVLKAAQLAHAIFVAHGWQWGGLSEPAEIPSVERIADRIKKMYDQARDSEAGVVSTGRLTIYRDDDSGEISVDIQLAELRDELDGWEEMLRIEEFDREFVPAADTEGL